VGIAAPRGFGRNLGALEDEGASIFDEPLDGFAFLEFESFSERGGTDEVELAGVIGALDELDFGMESHRPILILAISLVNKTKRFFLTTAEAQRKTRRTSRGSSPSCFSPRFPAISARLRGE
jgi:hypothetical protein